MKKFIWILIIYISLTGKNVSAFATIASCNYGTVVTTGVAASILSFGMYDVYISLFDMVNAEASNRPGVGGRPGGCRISSSDVYFNFSFLDPTSTPTPFAPTTTTYHKSAGDTLFWLFPPAAAIVANEADQVCVEFFTVAFGFQPVGCKYRKDPSTTTGRGAACFLGQSCGGTGTAYSQTPMPVAAQVVQCTFETISNIFSNAKCTTAGSSSINTFHNFQDSMRDIIRSALIIYVALFGAKIALGAEIPSHGEVYMFFFKLLMVIYFSVGFSNGMDAVTQFMLPLTQSLPGDLSNLIFAAGGSSGLCVYPPTSYPPGYQYLALFDSIDCRIANYFGFMFDNLGNVISVSLILSFIPALFAFQIPFMICIVVFAIFFLFVVISFTHAYVIAMILVAILVYVAPLFVPFALFSFTKGYFDAWLKLLLSYVFQPMILAAFMALMMSVFDSLLYGDCTFSLYPIHALLGNQTTNMYSINGTDANCTNSFGYIFGSFIKNGNLVTTIETFFFGPIDSMNPSVFLKLNITALTIALFAILFSSVVEQVSAFAGELTGGNAIGKIAVTPAKLGAAAKDAGKRVYHAAKAAVEARTGNKQAAAQDAQKAIQGDKKQGDGGGGGGGAPPPKDPPGGGAAGGAGPKKLPGGGAAGGGGGGKQMPKIPGK